MPPLLQKVNKLGKKAYEQCAGFLRVPESADLLDNTAVHPESYEAARAFLCLCGCSAEDIKNGRMPSVIQNLEKSRLPQLADQLGVDISGAKNNKERAELIAATTVQAPANETGGAR